ncbi:MAG: peptidylprolyl isomerase [Pseudorhodobacter sp.]
MLNKTARQALFGMIGGMAMALPVAAQDTTTPPAPPEGGAAAVVASVNGSDITLGHMIVLRQSLPPQYQALPDDVLFRGILDQLVQQATLAQSVESDLKLRDRMALDNDRRGYLSGVALGAVVNGAVTDEALQTAYAERFENAEPRIEYNAAHILVTTEEEAAKLKADIDGGADFAELARAHSSDGAAANGGNLGWFSEGMMVAPFQEAVTAMEAGSVSDPVQTQFGWHLIQLKETRQAAAPTLDEVRDQLASEIEQSVVKAHIAKLTEGAAITRPGEAFDPALLRATELLDQ